MNNGQERFFNFIMERVYDEFYSKNVGVNKAWMYRRS